MTRYLFVIIVLPTLISCTNFQRGPSSIDSPLREYLRNQYTQNLEEELKTINSDHSIPIVAFGGQSIDTEVPVRENDVFSYPHRNKVEEFVISDLSHYEVIEGKEPKIFVYDPVNTINYTLRIRNQVLDNQDTELRNVKGNEFFNAELKCDGPFKLKDAIKIHSSDGRSVQFKLFGKLKRLAPRTSFTPGKNTKNCTLSWENSLITDKKFRVNLISESAYTSANMMRLRSSFQNCILPNASEELSSMQKFFLTNSYRQLTCPTTAEELKLLENRVDGFNSKVRALLGRDLPVEVIEAQNPYVDLDFSKAPKLDMIIVSYLIYQSDFSGMLLTRLLDWHAKRGTQIRIFVSDVVQSKKNKAMLNKLALDNPSVKVLEYKFNAKSKHGTIISQLHRVNHIKIFSTISFDNPQHNLAIIGGRNIHDGFLFKEGIDQTKYPELISYFNKGLAYWRDFEIEVRSTRFTHDVVGQFYTVWDQDEKTSYVRSWVQNVSSDKKVTQSYFSNTDQKPLLRHYISTPYSENRLIQDLFAEMIDKAHRKVLISTPYFRLSKPLVAAFERAIERNVEIVIITRMNLDGDTLGSFLGETNKAGINKFYDKIKVYNYTEDKVILHSKIVLIDDEFSFLGSVNLNRRSFIHDTENAVMVYGKAFNKDIETLYKKDYINLSKLVTEKQKQVFWKKIIIDLFSDKF